VGEGSLRDFLDDSDVPNDSLSRVFVDTRHNKEGFRLLDELLQSPVTANHARARALVGPARCGKTTFVREYLKSCLRSEEGRRPLKYLYVEMRDDTKPASIAFETLRMMDDPNPGYGTPAQRSARVLNLIERRGYDLIIYDEAHNLVDSETKRVEERGVKWFNSLLNDCRRPLLLIGYERLEPVIKRNASLGGRMKPFPHFRPHRHDDPDDLLEMQWILGHLEPQLGFSEKSNLPAELTAIRVCIAARGRIGQVEALLDYARDLARRDRHSCLTNATLAKATEDYYPLWGELPFNPFRAEDPVGAAKLMKVSPYVREA